MKKFIGRISVLLFAAVFMLQGCADSEVISEAAMSDEALSEEKTTEESSKPTILEEKLEKESEKEWESEEEQSTGYTFMDDLGRTVTVESHDRVVTMIGSFTDIWLLAGGEVVGAANDSWTSLNLELGEDVVNIGSHIEPDIEKLIALKPDFVIASANTDADVDMEKILTNAGITSAFFAVSNFNDYMNMLEICTDITGRKDLLEQNGYAVKAKIDKVRDIANERRINGEKAPTVVYLRASASSIKAKGSYGNVCGEMLSDLGCINIADSDDSLLDELSMEAIITANPDFIFVTTQGNDTEAVLKNVEETLLNNPAWNKLTAVKEGRYYMLEKELYNLKPNVRWGEAYEKLADILYGDI